MEIIINDRTESLSAAQITLVENLLKLAKQELKLTGPLELSVSFLNNEEIQQYNREYRGIDRPTDVISFALEDETEALPLDVLKEFDLPRQLGDILISLERTKEQAKEYEHSFDRELGFLVVHGFLHLNGYDHQTEEDEKEMFRLQRKILADYGLER